MSIFRNTVWFLKGMREYTKKGYESASRNFCDADLEVDKKGYNFMITGANSGIGKAAAIEIGKHGGNIHMVCRNMTTAEEAKKEIVEKTGNENVHIHHLDLSDSTSIFKFVQDFSKTNEALHVLINNAGCMINTRQLNENSMEKNFATNTLGTYILTMLLVPLLKKANNARVVTVSSGGMLVQKLNHDDLQFETMSPFDGTMAYAQNKRQQVVMMQHYAKMLPQIHFTSMHPGWADTPAVRSSMPEFYEKMQGKLRTAEQGADTIVWLALADDAVKLPSGSFVQDRKVASTHLPLAWTKVSADEDEKFMTKLADLSKVYINDSSIE